MKKKSLLVLGVGAVMVAAVLGGCGKKDKEADPTPTITPTLEATPTPEKAPAEVLADILGQIKEAYGENYMPQMEYPETWYNEVMGADASLYDAAVGEGPLMSAHVEAFIGFHATEGNVEALKTAVTAYQDNLKNDTFQYPMNVPRIQASVVEVVGDYVFFYMLGGVDTTEFDSDEEAIKACIEANKIASGIIQNVIGK